VACWNVCPARIKDVTRIAELGSGNVDDCLGVSRLYFCAVRNVETSSHSDCALKSARPKITAGTNHGGGYASRAWLQRCKLHCGASIQTHFFDDSAYCRRKTEVMLPPIIRFIQHWKPWARRAGTFPFERA
jgi:hypothetical protein